MGNYRLKPDVVFEESLTIVATQRGDLRDSLNAIRWREVALDFGTYVGGLKLHALEVLGKRVEVGWLVGALAFDFEEGSVMEISFFIREVVGDIAESELRVR